MPGELKGGYIPPMTIRNPASTELRPLDPQILPEVNIARWLGEIGETRRETMTATAGALLNPTIPNPHLAPLGSGDRPETRPIVLAARADAITAYEKPTRTIFAETSVQAEAGFEILREIMTPLLGLNQHELQGDLDNPGVFPSAQRVAATSPYLRTNESLRYRQFVDYAAQRLTLNNFTDEQRRDAYAALVGFFESSYRATNYGEYNVRSIHDIITDYVAMAFTNNGLDRISTYFIAQKEMQAIKSFPLTAEHIRHILENEFFDEAELPMEHHFEAEGKRAYTQAQLTAIEAQLVGVPGARLEFDGDTDSQYLRFPVVGDGYTQVRDGKTVRLRKLEARETEAIAREITIKGEALPHPTLKIKEEWQMRIAEPGRRPEK
ncbi:MAG: hypothetical protein ACREGI_03340 [Candidatus Levyibacteriota bacterium]